MGRNWAEISPSGDFDPPKKSTLSLQVQPGSFRNPPHSISPGTGRKFPCANPPRLTQSSASVCQMTNVLGSRLTSRCAESLSEIKPLYSEVNDACFAAQAPSPLSPVPSTECRCHRWCNSIPLKAFCPLFLFQSQEYFLSIAKKKKTKQIFGLELAQLCQVTAATLPCLPAQISLTVASPGVDLPIFHQQISDICFLGRKMRKWQRSSHSLGLIMGGRWSTTEFILSMEFMLKIYV